MKDFKVEYDQENWANGRHTHVKKTFKDLEAFRQEFRYDKICSDIKNLRITCARCRKMIKIKPKAYKAVHHFKLNDKKKVLLRGRNNIFQDEFCSKRCRGDE